MTINTIESQNQCDAANITMMKAVKRHADQHQHAPR